MKKITTLFTAILLIGTVLFFACKKDEPAPISPAESCTVIVTNAAVAFQTKAQAFETKVKTNPMNYSKTECVALKTEGLNLIATTKACPELATNTILIATLQAQANAFICPE